MSAPVRTPARAVSLARHKVRAHFLALHAIEPGDAIEYAPPSPTERREFEKLARDGIIRAAAPGNYWLDLSRLDAAIERRRRKWVPLTLLAALTTAFVAILSYQG
ncbi:hypothetical protein [Sphingomonas baiyangensis]|uniref:Uncharacterized protein n=1 Tax=Sphingomonas baiyangensis TaxID=2572576 RepID=A0A4U1L628_9SPHN|nr:hypothetical protein [Sphingomonas baiyangensis]TKD51763.1 hypothetical protein FBR43_14120 [Sphingomonas baiyangensis]